MSRLLFTCILCAGCATEPLDFKDSAWQQISGRDEGQPVQRFPIYRALAPPEWNRQDPQENLSISDTMKSLCEFNIGDATDALRITIHSFPSKSASERIPPASQIARWKQQFDTLSPSDIITIPLARGGFIGLYFEASGIIHETESTVLGWSMQMAPEQYQNLQGDNFEDRHRRADYTIKCVGSQKAIQLHYEKIHTFANSFELIEEIPTR